MVIFVLFLINGTNIILVTTKVTHDRMSEPTKQEISQVFKKLRSLGPNKVSILEIQRDILSNLSRHVRTRVSLISA